jgi:hypothetical protein
MNPALLGHMIARQTASDYYPETISMNPAWRRTLVHFVPVEAWADGMDQAIIDQVYQDITNKKVERLRNLSPDTGAYFNEADFNQLDWQWAFFGENYARLKDIKGKYDPNNTFWCRQCVGSEALVQQKNGKLCTVDATGN